MKKIIVIIIILLLLGSLSIFLYNNYRIKHAEIEVDLVDNLDIEVYSNIKIKALIKKINGKLIKNKQINTKKIGKKEITFDYINDDNIKVSYKIDINIVDTTPPVISEINTINIQKDHKGNIEERLFCADNYDKTPKCEIVGDYNVSEIGSYNLIYQGTDSSNNISSHDLVLNVIENNEKNQDTTSTNFSDIYTKFKNNDTKIGIDVSYHQGDIDYQKLKESGVEFAFIRLGYGYNNEGENVLDSNFIKNIKGFKKVNIPVGIYFFSYAENKKEAKDQANFVLKELKKYKINLPIVFDWEDFKNLKKYKLSLYDINEIAGTFIEKIENKGYKTMLYSSKNNLKYVWNEQNYNIWLAHYNENEDYKNRYALWQVCDDGKIEGINGNVDIDIMYK